MTTIDDTLLHHILQAHGLGTVQTMTRPARGSINPYFIVNEAYGQRPLLTTPTMPPAPPVPCPAN